MSATRPPVVSRPVFPLTTVFPTATRCLQVQVPDDPYYLSLFYGQIQQLTYWYNYDRDSLHRGSLIAQLWKRCILNIKQCPAPTVVTVGTGFEVGECMQIKQDPANPCLVREVCPDGSLGCVVIDLSLCKPNFTPGGGTTPPAAQACETYSLSIQANAVTLMPFVVNTGDTLLLSSVTGASSDPSLHWFCPDGSFYVLGACAGGGYTSGGDPLPTTLHDALLWRIGSNYYPVSSSLFTVPAGVVNQPIYVQVNNPSLGSVAGGFNISFTFCNKQPVGGWCQAFDFTLSPQGFAGIPRNDANGTPHPIPTWVAGVGWQHDALKLAPATTFENLWALVRPLGTGATITSAELLGNLADVRTDTFGLDVSVAPTPTVYPPGFAVLFNWTTPTGTGNFDHSSGAISVASQAYVTIDMDNYSMPSGASPAVTITKLILRGTGTNPFGSSNCT